MSEIAKITEQLGDLYTATGQDWDINIHHCLTEPTCPSVSIQPEGWHITRYRFDCDSVEDGVKRAVAHVKAEIIDRKVIGHACPFTNLHDQEFEIWLRARAAGSDEPLPHKSDDH